MRVYLAAICLFTSTMVQADWFGDLKALGEELQKHAPANTQSINNPTAPTINELILGPCGIVVKCSDLQKFANNPTDPFNIRTKDWT